MRQCPLSDYARNHRVAVELHGGHDGVREAVSGSARTGGLLYEGSPQRYLVFAVCAENDLCRLCHRVELQARDAEGKIRGGLPSRNLDNTHPATRLACRIVSCAGVAEDETAERRFAKVDALYICHCLALPPGMSRKNKQVTKVIPHILGMCQTGGKEEAKLFSTISNITLDKAYERCYNRLINQTKNGCKTTLSTTDFLNFLINVEAELCWSNRSETHGSKDIQEQIKQIRKEILDAIE